MSYISDKKITLTLTVEEACSAAGACAIVSTLPMFCEDAGKTAVRDTLFALTDQLEAQGINPQSFCMEQYFQQKRGR